VDGRPLDISGQFGHHDLGKFSISCMFCCGFYVGKDYVLLSTDNLVKVITLDGLTFFWKTVLCFYSLSSSKLLPVINI